jgi:uncharacterized protein YndB with AHSA1/START domain
MVKVEEVINASVDEVWAAITNHGQMIKWYFENIPDFKPEVGFSTSFVMQSDERIFTATWLVTRVIPKKEIRYEWSYKEYDGLGPVTFTLSARGDKTLLSVVNEGLESFPKNISEFTEESCRGGWEYFIKGRLPEYFGNNK